VGRLSEGQHGPECGCTRCRGFEPENAAAAKHGAYSGRRFAPVADEHYARLRRSIESSIGWDEVYEFPTRALARITARNDIVADWLTEHGLVDEDGNVAAVVRELARWEAREIELAKELALTTRSRDGLDLDRVRKAHGLVSLQELRPVVNDVFAAAWVAVEEALGELSSVEDAARVKSAFQGAYMRRLHEVTTPVQGEHFALPAPAEQVDVELGE
jgi:hypothetical protein